MWNWLKQQFCSHKYNVEGSWKCTFRMEDGTLYDCSVEFLECPKCGKRRVIRLSDYHYKDTLLDIFKLWEKRQIEVEFEVKK